MMHENNCKVIQEWSKGDYANAYRDYVNNWGSVHFWTSSFLPESTTVEEDYNLLEVCKHFHETGF